FSSLAQSTPDGWSSRAVLFPDTLTNYTQPDIGLAAVRLLNRARCEVSLGPPALRCCGRPMISNGMLTQAVANARANVALLYPSAAAGTPIVACDPSCILTIKDDYPALLRGEARRQAEVVAAACLTFDELLERLLTMSAVCFRAGPKRVLLQGHCHE